MSSYDQIAVNQNRVQDLEDQKNALILETQKFHRAANCKRHAVMLMTGLMRAMDPLFTIQMANLENSRAKLGPLRKKVTDEVQSRQLLRECNGMEGELFLSKGSLTEQFTYTNLIAKLKKTVPRHVPEVEHEHRSYYTIMSRHCDIFQYLTNQQPKLFKRAKRDKAAEVNKKLKQLNQDINHEIERAHV